MKKIAATTCLALALCSSPPTQAGEDPLKPLAFFIGEWRGEENATFGHGTGTRTYEMILSDRYLLSRNHSSFKPQKGLPEGEEHQDWTFFSYDQGRETYVIRQFHGEGFVNRFVLDPSSEVPKHMVFVSEASENAPPGLRARLTFTQVSTDEFEEVFELAVPGKELSVLVRNRWSRVVAGT